jgi:hypothetical protein
MRNDTRDAWRRFRRLWITSICRRNCVAWGRACTRVTRRNLHGKGALQEWEGVTSSGRPSAASPRGAASIRHILFRTTSDQEVALPSDRALVVTENMTLDGVIDLEGGWFSPAGGGGAVDTSDIEATLREHMQAQDALLLGRVTFESFREYWPKQTTRPASPLTSTGCRSTSYHRRSRIRNGRTRPSFKATSARRCARSKSSPAVRSASPEASASSGR